MVNNTGHLTIKQLKQFYFSLRKENTLPRGPEIVTRNRSQDRAEDGCDGAWECEWVLTCKEGTRMWPSAPAPVLYCAVATVPHEAPALSCDFILGFTGKNTHPGILQSSFLFIKLPPDLSKGFSLS